MKTNKIEFNKFLHKQRVFSVLTTHCLYDEDHMIVKHVLFFCLNWRKKKKENVTKNENHEHKTIIQWTQSDHDRYAHDINNQFAESISDDEIIERKENFLFIKFSNEEFLSTRQ